MRCGAPGSSSGPGGATARGSRSLLLINCFIAGLLTVLPWTGTLIGDPSRGMGGAAGALLVMAMIPIQAALVAAVILGLTAVEHAGVRFFSARRGWRLTRGAAWMVCAHASVGWLMGPALAFLGLAAYYGVERFFGVSAHGTVHLSLGRAVDLGTFGWDHLVQIAIILGSYMAGLVWFEMLVYVGVRRCRFANSPRPDQGEVGAAPASA